MTTWAEQQEAEQQYRQNALEFGHTMSREEFDKSLKADARYYDNSVDSEYAAGDRRGGYRGANNRPVSVWAQEQSRIYDTVVPVGLQYPTGRDPASKTFASDTWADISRLQWEDYDKRFIPQEDQLIGMMTYNNPELVGESVAKSSSAAGKGFDMASRMTDQHRARYGMAMSRGEAQHRQRTNQGQRTAAVVGAENQARQRLQERNREIALGMSNGATMAAEAYR